MLQLHSYAACAEPRVRELVRRRPGDRERREASRSATTLSVTPASSTVTDSLAPEAVSGIEEATAVTVGIQFECALLSSGHIDCWGYPPNSTSIETTPQPVSGISSATAIADAGYAHTCAVISSGEDYCWGYNENGQLGDGNYEYSYTPVKVEGLSGSAVQPGGSVVSSCALLAGGSVECWGAGGSGQLGDGRTENSLVPVPVSGIG